MFIFTYAAAVLATTYAVAAAAFLLTSRKSPERLVLGLYLVTAVAWIGANVVADISFTQEMLILSSGIAFIAGGLNLCLCLTLIDTIIDGRVPSARRIFIYAFLTTGPATLSFTEFGIVGTYFPVNAPAQIVPGIIYVIGIFTMPAYLIYGAIRLVRSVRREQNCSKRMQVLYVLLGLLITMFGQAVFDIILPVFGELRFFNLGPASSVFFALCCGYAITRHRFLDIRIVIQRSLIYSILLSLCIGLYLALISALQGMYSIEASNDAVLWSAGITMILGICTVPIIERWFRKITDPLFFKDRLDYPSAMMRLGGGLQSADTQQLVERMESELSEILRAAYVRIHTDKTSSSSYTNPVSFSVPIDIDGEAGSIHIGPKRSGDRYTHEDEQLVETFASVASVALSRSKLYEQVRKHADELEHEVRERTKDLREAQESQRQVMIDLSHNLQTPLTILRTKIESLKGRNGDDSIRGLEQSVTSLSHFISQLLRLAGLTQALEDERWSRFSLSELVKDLAEEIQIISAKDSVRIETSIEPGIMFVGNEMRLREAVLNIAHNAVKYIGDGKKVIRFALSKTDGGILCTISDTGVGIASEQLPHIFERFYRASAGPGTGLGLPIAKEIISKHGGTVYVESTPGAGTTFTLEFPASA